MLEMGSAGILCRNNAGSLIQARIIDVMLHVTTLYHVAINANRSVTDVSQGRMARYFEPIMVPAGRPVSDPTLRVVIIVRIFAMMGLPVDSVPPLVKFVVSIPAVQNLAPSRVRLALKIAHGLVPTLEDAIYLALSLATNCPARSAVRKCWTVDINVLLFAERPVHHQLSTARSVARKAQEISWWIIYSAPLSVRWISMKTRAWYRIVVI